MISEEANESGNNSAKGINFFRFFDCNISESCFFDVNVNIPWEQSVRASNILPHVVRHGGDSGWTGQVCGIVFY